MSIPTHKRVVALGFAAALALGPLPSCTPKPEEAGPTAEDFLDAVAERDTGSMSSLVDDPGTASTSVDATWDGLQAEGMDYTIAQVSQQGNVATVDYTLTWDLPRERHFSSDARMTLTRAGDTWTVRWQPAVLNTRLGSGQHLELRSVPADQASAVSSDGVDLVRPGVAYRVLVDPAAAGDPKAVASRVSAALTQARAVDASVPELDEAWLAGAVASEKSEVSAAVVSSAAQPTVRQALDGVAGVRLNEEAAMVTVNPDFAPDIVSRVGDLVRDQLQGDAGWSVNIVNENGGALEQLAGESPRPAPAVHISLDYAVQKAAESALEPLAGQQAMIVALRPSTGGILAVAQTPAADKQGNLATMGQYPPGSTFKIITGSAGMELQGLNPDSIVPCPGSMNIYGRIVTNYAGFSLGNVPLQSAFARSCNTTFADISTQLAPGQLKDVGKKFGLGVDMTIPGIDTLTGSIPVGEEELERTEAGYGQGADLASPFGMALVSATAARGAMPVPYLIDGQVTHVDEQVDPPRPETIEQLRRLMAAVTAPGGTAAGMSAGGDIRGKTGEAEINQGSHAWFTGYRVDDDIAFATLIVLGGGSESAVAATNRMFLNLDASRQSAPN
ncbi:Beta-lactam-inducible penicillin-binding protein [Corynebacterium capitovis DSM 44611]|uniref:penicillin-binding transpeptidase domain-containing protein n=1 Tax=Corynebacterium capitovis TaxID=131081 RepID=UPI000379DB07|nr:penicillin-binding transpeptidase domain-containing protein [Corynebacterium capitovis]WKD57460.1 Beta-lactam-inducible penicillin-binding protein [Corynebacterium capitovis DSM 44611]